DLSVTTTSPEGVTNNYKGEWNFRWVLEGRAVQDTFIVPARGARGHPPPGKKESYGTTMRFFDPGREVWEITYIDPNHAAVFRLTARLQNGEIVQTGIDSKERTYRWVFFDMRPDGFRWRSEVLLDDGKSWRQEQLFVATRKGA